MKKGTRVKRGPTWNIGDENVGPNVEGIVLEDAAWGTDEVKVEWDNGKVLKYYEGRIRWGVEVHGVDHTDIWDVATGEVLRTLEGHTRDVNTVAISPCGKYVVSGSSDYTVKVFAL